jgi:hypothetical protein
MSGEAVLAFALAVALGAWLRRTLPAIGGALAGLLALLLGAGWAGADPHARQSHQRPRGSRCPWTAGSFRPRAAPGSVPSGQPVLAAPADPPRHPAGARRRPARERLVHHPRPSRLITSPRQDYDMNDEPATVAAASGDRVPAGARSGRRPGGHRPPRSGMRWRLSRLNGLGDRIEIPESACLRAVHALARRAGIPRPHPGAVQHAGVQDNRD